MAAAEAPLIAVVGPTAAGKSALGLRLARLFGGEIVSCDSLQVYRGLDVGSAKASRAEREEVPHHLLDVVEPDQPFSAADYARRARAAVREIAGRTRLPIVVGGTGLYLKALVDGLFEGPARQPGLRRRLEALAARFGDRRLHRLLRRYDPEAAARVEAADRLRVVRALEVYFATGRGISDHRRRGGEALAGFRLLTLGLRLERAALRRAVERRTEAMLAGGLLDEVASLLARGYPPDLRPLQAIGYRQGVAVIEGRLGRGAARDEIVRETMRYAKRQMTWFRHQSSPLWCDSAEVAVAAARGFLEGGAPSPDGPVRA